MSSIVSRVAARYKLAMDARRLQLAWHTFVSWELGVLVQDLDTLARTFESPKILEKSRYVASIYESLGELSQKFTPRFKGLDANLTGVADLRADVKKAVAPVLRELTRHNKVFNSYDVMEDIDESPVAKTLNAWGRDKLIDAISEMPLEGPTPENIEWLRSLDFNGADRAYTRITSAIPDFPTSNGEPGSFDYFENWARNLPNGWDDWEDAIPIDGEELSSTIWDETELCKRLDRRISGGDKTVFEYIQDSLHSFIDDLNSAKEGVG